MIRLLVFLLTLGALSARADLVLTGRLEDVAGKKNLSERALLKAQFNQTWEHFGLFMEGFGEAEGADEQARERRAESKAYLQELYAELKFDPIYIKVGRQAVRWSDTWVFPSLDVWTERRWNRLFFDPTTEQFIHPTGVDVTFVQPTWSIEAFYASEIAQSEFPKPLPIHVEEKNTDASFGGRLKAELGSFGFSLIGARAGWRDWQGVGANYAFEQFVPKFESGVMRDRGPIPPSGLFTNYFTTFGVDIFLSEWSFQPQVTIFDVGDIKHDSSDFQSIAYLSGTWKHQKHELLLQGFRNMRTEDAFGCIEYTYNWKKWFQTAAFVQNYAGIDGGLLTIFQEMTDGTVGGLRLIFSTDL